MGLRDGRLKRSEMHIFDEAFAMSDGYVLNFFTVATVASPP
jgi:hypothetical protein